MKESQGRADKGDQKKAKGDSDVSMVQAAMAREKGSTKSSKPDGREKDGSKRKVSEDEYSQERGDRGGSRPRETGEGTSVKKDGISKSVGADRE